jgi:nitrogen fixation NifU-like protein
MSDLRELYQSVILDHNKRPRNKRTLDAANRRAEGNNPLCGDHVTVQLDLQDGVVREVAFEGSGCAISTASASMMTETVKGRSSDEIETIFHRFHDVVTGGPTSEPPPDALAALGKLAVFAGVREYPARIKCATLVWHALRSALGGQGQTVTTESSSE